MAFRRGLTVIALLWWAAAPLRVAAAEQISGAAPVTRCGWFENPSPANVTLTDRDGEWLIGMQGGHQADGDWPRFRKSEWVATNGSYGHGCACLKVIADPKTREVKQIVSAKARPLKACRGDKALKEPED
jgi:hypothetical protein